jgi:hypothetical protein
VTEPNQPPLQLGQRVCRNWVAVFFQAFEVTLYRVTNVYHRFVARFACEMQLGNAGHSATNTPSSSGSIVTRNFTAQI